MNNTTRYTPLEIARAAATLDRLQFMMAALSVDDAGLSAVLHAECTALLAEQTEVLNLLSDALGLDPADVVDEVL